MGTDSLRQLKVWQQAHQLVLVVYRQTGAFPDGERYGLVAQMRRAAVSVPANIAEGYKRRGGKDKIRFYNMAEASLDELRYYFLLCRDLGLGQANSGLEDRASEIARMLNGLIKRIESSA